MRLNAKQVAFAVLVIVGVGLLIGGIFYPVLLAPGAAALAGAAAIGSQLREHQSSANTQTDNNKSSDNHANKEVDAIHKKKPSHDVEKSLLHRFDAVKDHHKHHGHSVAEKEEKHSHHHTVKPK